ncbi:hypothetical protein XA68_17129 [Ophiocordyceps unilateralis]|uniref:Uncharacterized protein n=1 Tax=Ophiocordyceps unilateralis TaxID=268505 RepID=A0A2A9P3Y5_OPHUN|nr:hypothetical protein XA68_17129 [Ophiocordyceps unilateralis]
MMPRHVGYDHELSSTLFALSEQLALGHDETIANAQEQDPPRSAPLPPPASSVRLRPLYERGFNPSGGAPSQRRSPLRPREGAKAITVAVISKRTVFRCVVFATCRRGPYRVCRAVSPVGIENALASSPSDCRLESTESVISGSSLDPNCSLPVSLFLTRRSP